MSKDSPKKSPDYLLFFVAVFLVVWGFFTMSLISFPLSLNLYGSVWYYVSHQGIMLLVGILLAVIAFKFPLDRLKKWAFWIFLANLIMLALVFMPFFGVALKGSRRWINCGLFLFQPSEFLKLTFIVYLAAWLTAKQEIRRERQLKELFLPFLAMVALLLVLLIKQPDLSTLVIIALVALVVYFFANTSFLHIIAVLGAGSALGYLLIRSAPYRLSRLTTFLNPDLDALGKGYHLKQALIAVGSGKVFGMGQGFSFGLSRQKFGFLPDPMTDSIFAIIGEELGFFGGALLILLFLFFAWRGFRLVKARGNSFQGLMAGGITFWLTFQTLFSIGGIIGICPLAGIPLPFFSYGGSHLVAELIGVGILLNISKENKK